MIPRDLQELMKKLGTEETVRVVAKNFAVGIVDQMNLPNNEKIYKALEEAFVRGANWRLIQDKRKKEREEDSK